MRLYPRSFRKLLLVGFALVALPLIFALINTAISVDQLARRSQKTVYQAVQATQNSRRLTELLTAMERSARQMVILGDRSLLDTYVSNREKLLETARQFRTLPFDTEQAGALNEIVRGEAAIFAILSDAGAQPQRLQNAVADFVDLADRAQIIQMRSSELIDREVETLRATAARAQQITYWQLLALIPVMVFLMTGFAILIARPIRQIDAAIRRLGGGEFNVPVVVGGPLDLQHLGARLEWMRCRLIELEQQKTRFLMQVSHELKTPLTALREGAELLSEEAAGKLTEEQREIAAILCHNSIELQKLIEDLLNYGASQFQRVALERRTLNVKQVIERVADDQKLALKAKNLKLEIKADDVTLTADFEKLRVVLDNLMSNAIKFSPRCGVITIAAKREGAHVELDVGDDGPGIAREDRMYIFEPFYQGRNNSIGLIKGNGIGLSVVREYITAHGGSVDVVDTGQVTGACFRVRLPVSPPEGGL